MGIQDTITKLKIQASALCRGIHGDFILVERADFKVLLADHERLTKLMWSGIDRSMEQWKKELSDGFNKEDGPAKFREMYMAKFADATDPPKTEQFRLYWGGREGGKAFTDAELKELKEGYFSREKPLENDQHAGKICDVTPKPDQVVAVSNSGNFKPNPTQARFLNIPEEPEYGDLSMHEIACDHSYFDAGVPGKPNFKCSYCGSLKPTAIKKNSNEN